MTKPKAIDPLEVGRAVSQSREGVRRITPTVLGDWLRGVPGERALMIVDVREAHELVGGQIPNAIHAPLRGLAQGFRGHAAQNSTPLVVYCESGVRSQRAAEQLILLGYSNVYSLDGGFAAWKRAKLPLVVPERTTGNDALSEEQIERYSRHLRLPQMGESNQKKLLQSRVLLVGVGGLGTPTALYLAAAGVGTLGLVDGDRVELSNLQRQILHSTSRIGMPKVDSAAQVLTDLNRDVSTKNIEARLTEANVSDILGQGWNVVIDGSDNYSTRYLLNDACCERGIPVVFGSVQGFEGRVMTVIPGRGPCYRCAFPIPPPEGLTCSCDAAGVLGVLPGVIGVLQATEAIKIITSLGEPLVGRMLHYDALAMRFMTLNVPKNAVCGACGNIAG